MAHYSPALRKPSRWPLLAPIALVAVLAIAWTGVWFYAAGRAETELAAWRQRESQAGRRQACATQSIDGYPFRIEMRCGGASFGLNGQPSLDLRLPQVLAAVQVYDPRLLVSELTSPLEMSEPGRPPSQVVSWRLAQASLRGLPADLERASVMLDAPTVRDASSEVVMAAKRAELHGRRTPAYTPGRPVVEAVLRLNGAVAERLHPLAAKPIDAEIAAVMHGPVDIAPKPWAERLREWQGGDGRLEIVSARIAQDDVIAVGAGSLQLTPRGMLQGDLQVTVAGIEKLLKMFNIDRLVSEGQIGETLNALDRLVPGLGGIARQNAAPGLLSALGQRTVLEGRAAVTFPLRLVDGAVVLGPFRVGVLPPLF
ncbi:MAG: DUF2125 domain-containing protein [Hyphomicrobiales bacterium]|nr:DUF2125 domain-containing protein [Hyphomicrobiales bacterium]